MQTRLKKCLLYYNRLLLHKVNPLSESKKISKVGYTIISFHLDRIAARTHEGEMFAA